MTAALAISGVAKSYGGRRVLAGVDLDVAPRETVAVLGANGAGKSTLLRIAATLARPDAGELHVTGVDARARPEAARRLLAAVTQDHPVYAELTPHEHLVWWARVQDHAAAPAEVERATLDAGLAHAAHRPAGRLSRGQRQRLALAMATLPPRPLWLLDEPFAALDALGRDWLVARLASHDGAALLALHDEALARTVADRVLRLRQGRLEAVA